MDLFVDILCAYAVFVNRAAGIPLQAHQLLCADGECCSYSDPGPRGPASSDPTWPAYTGRKTSGHHTDGTDGVSLSLNNSSFRTTQTKLPASLFFINLC